MTGFEVLNLNSNIKSLERYQSLYFFTIHLNDDLGRPFLRNNSAHTGSNTQINSREYKQPLIIIEKQISTKNFFPTTT